jgi:hypothetical protein
VNTDALSFLACGWRTLLATIIPLLVAVGCGSAADGPARVAVQGTVELDGQPLTAGTIRFVPTGSAAGPKTSVEIENGEFRLPAEVGPVIGQHRIEIEAPLAGGLAMDDEEALENLRRQRVPPGITVLRVPPIYNVHSTLTANLTENGPNNLFFRLRTMPRH